MGKREILFRGKRPDDGKWVYGYFTKNRNFCNRVYSAIRPHDPIEGDEYVEEIQVVVPETVGQYTGLKDVNGRKIFEGDIVEGLFYYGLRILGVVVFKGGAFGLEWARGGVKEF